MAKSHKNRELTVVVLIALTVAFVLFGQIIGGDFIGDDHTIVENREDLYSLRNLPKFFRLPAFPDKPSIRLYRPLTLSSYAFNLALSEKAGSFHFVNILLHALSTVLVFLIGREFLSRRANWLTTVGFIFLPIHVEAFVPVVGRSEIMSVFFGLISLLLFWRRRYWLSSAAFLLALLSKEFVIFLLPIFGFLLLLEPAAVTGTASAKVSLGRFLVGRLWPALKTGLYFVPPLAVYFLLRYLALGKYAFGSFIFNPVTAPLAFLNFKERLFTGLYGFYVYIRQTFYPVNLVPDYSYNQMPAIQSLFTSPGTLIGLVLLMVLVGLIIFGRRDIKIAATLVLVPFVFISNIFIVTSGSFAERWWYFPSFGVMALAGIGLDEAFKRFRKLEKPVYFFGTLLLTWYSYLGVSYSQIWLNDRTFYVNVAKRAVANAWARSNLAAVYLHEGEFEKAWTEARAALEIHDKYPPTLNIVAQLYWQENNFKEAEANFKKALAYDVAGRNARGLNRMLAFLNLDYGQNQEALSYMDKVLTLEAAAGEKRVAKVDQTLYEYIKGLAKRDPRSYSEKEKDELVKLIRIVRGF